MKKLCLFFILILPVFFLAAQDKNAQKKAAQAKALYQQYLSLKKQRGTTPQTMEKLTAAIALDPACELYPYVEMTDSWGSYYYKQDFNARLRLLNTQLQRARTFKKKFPKSIRTLYTNPEIMNWKLWVHNGTEKETLKKAAEFTKTLQTLALNERFIRTDFAFDLADGLQDINELEECLRYYYRDELPFFARGSLENYLKTRFQDALMLLPHLEELCKKNERTAEAVNARLRETGIFSLSHMFLWPEQNKETDRVYLEYLQFTADKTDMLCQSPIPVVKAAGQTLKMMLLCSQAGINKEKIKRSVFAFLQELASINSNWIDGGAFPETGRPLDIFLEDALASLPHKSGVQPSKIALEQLAEFRANRAGDGISKAEMLALFRSKNPADIRKRIPDIRKEALSFIKDPEIRFAFAEIPSADQAKLLPELNRDYKIKSELYASVFKHKAELRCLGGIYENGLFVLLLSERKTGTYYAGIISGTKKARLLLLPPAFMPFSKEIRFDKTWCVTINEKTAAFACPAGIFTGNSNKVSWEKLNFKADGLQCRGLKLMQNKQGQKLFCLFGHGSASGASAALCSLKPDGTLIKTYFDSRRKKPETDLDSLKGPADGFAELGPNLYFRVGNALYVCRTENDKVEKVADFSFLASNAAMLAAQNCIWIEEGHSRARLFRINPADGKKELFLQQSDTPTPEALHVIPQGGKMLLNPGVMDETGIWFGGERAFRLLTAAPEKSPFLWLPETLTVLPGPDGSAVFLTRTAFVSVKPKSK